MFKVVIAFCLAALSMQASATQMICNSKGVMFEAVAWDTQTKVATIKDIGGVQHSGKLIAERKQGKGEVIAELYNLRFVYDTATVKGTVADLLVVIEDRRPSHAFGSISYPYEGEKLLTDYISRSEVSCAKM